MPFAETTVNETVTSDTKINDIQTCEAKETEIDETQMREKKKDTLTGEIVYLKAQVSDAFILNELTNCFLGCDETMAQDYLVKPYYDYLEEQGYMSSGQYLYENEFEILNILQLSLIHI